MTTKIDEKKTNWGQILDQKLKTKIAKKVTISINRLESYIEIFTFDHLYLILYNLTQMLSNYDGLFQYILRISQFSLFDPSKQAFIYLYSASFFIITINSKLNHLRKSFLSFFFNIVKHSFYNCKSQNN